MLTLRTPVALVAAALLSLTACTAGGTVAPSASPSVRPADLPFSWSGVGERSFTDAVAVLREAGATDVAFVGASKGGMYAAALADELDPVTVVALGPPGSTARRSSS